METLALFLEVLILGAAFWVASKVLLRFSDRIERIERASVEPLEEFDPAYLEARLESLTIAVSEGISHVDRAEQRVATTVRSAQKKFRAGGFEHPGVEAEAENLPDLDGSGVEGRELQLVPEDMEDPVEDNEPSGVPGMTVGELERFRIERASSA